jgi:hypothetical protein
MEPMQAGTLAGLRARSEGALATGTLRPSESLDSVWNHLCAGLEALAEKGGAADLPENGLTQRLVIELERRAGARPYFFHSEYMEDDSDGRGPRVDIAAVARDAGGCVVNGVSWAGGKRFLALEAKRLPTPGTGREREYLSGKNGGVARFKLGRHAAELNTVGIIGYVQRHAFNHWLDTINNWVEELIASSKPELPWDNSDKLQMEEALPRLARLRSSNLRVADQQRLSIRHIWVQLANDTGQSGHQAA